MAKMDRSLYRIVSMRPDQEVAQEREKTRISLVCSNHKRTGTKGAPSHTWLGSKSHCIDVES